MRTDAAKVSGAWLDRRKSWPRNPAWMPGPSGVSNRAGVPRGFSRPLPLRARLSSILRLSYRMTDPAGARRWVMVPTSRGLWRLPTVPFSGNSRSRATGISRKHCYVLSTLLTRSLVLERNASGENDDDVDRVVAAFKAADSAIQTTLSGGGEWGVEEAKCVLSLLLTRYGTAFSRRSAKGVEVGVDFVQAACDQAKRALPDDVVPK